MSTQTPSTTDLLAGGAPSAKFATVGTTIKGTVISAEDAQQTDFDSGKPKFYEDSGKPMMQVVISVQTDDRDPEIPNDDGERRIFCKGQMLSALKAALRSAGMDSHTFRRGGALIAVQYTGDGEPSKRGLNPPKQFAVQVKHGASLLDGGTTEAATPAQDLL